MDNKELIAIIESAARDGASQLNLSDGRLTTIPTQIGHLTSLKELDLRH